jgi:hypothetical protein
MASVDKAEDNIQMERILTERVLRYSQSFVRKWIKRWMHRNQGFPKDDDPRDQSRYPQIISRNRDDDLVRCDYLKTSNRAVRHLD